MAYTIAVPHHPGSNGDHDVIQRIKDTGMTPLPLYFDLRDPKQLEENARLLREADGAVIPGGFPYEDRIGFGKIPSKIRSFADAMHALIEKGKPVLAFCAGNQIAQAMKLITKDISLEENICDTDGRLAYHGFYDGRAHVKLASDKTAFGRFFEKDDVIPTIVDHGGGRFTTSPETLKYLTENGLIVTQYSDANGNVVNNFPICPNGSMGNIDAIRNPRGNLQVSMTHFERTWNALNTHKANFVFWSMCEYLEDGCPDLGKNIEPFTGVLPIKKFDYLSTEIPPELRVDIYVKMLTDDNTLNTARLFLGENFPIDRRRVLSFALREKPTPETAKKVLEELAKLDFFDGIMLKKDLPTLALPGYTATYEVVDRTGGKITRGFTERSEIVPGMPVAITNVPQLNPTGYRMKGTMQRSPFLREQVTDVKAGGAWFFPDEKSRDRALEELLG